jgi:hypothetical protein
VHLDLLNGRDRLFDAGSSEGSEGFRRLFHLTLPAKRYRFGFCFRRSRVPGPFKFIERFSGDFLSRQESISMLISLD